MAFIQLSLVSSTKSFSSTSCWCAGNSSSGIRQDPWDLSWRANQILKEVSLLAMTSKSVRWLVFTLCVVIIAWIVSLIRRSIPYSDSDEILSTIISIDSVWSLGPTVTIYDKNSRKSYWIKSYTSFDHSNIDLLKTQKANVRYMKFLQGPLENRIVWMKVDSVVIIDQVIGHE